MQPDALPESVAVGKPDMTLFGAAERAFNLATSLRIDSQAMYEAAAEDLVRIKGISKKLEDSRTTLKRPILEAGREIDNFFRAPLDYCGQAEKAIKKGMLTWSSEQERIARERQAKLDEEARIERERLQAQAAALAAAGDHDKAEQVAQIADITVAPVVAIASAPAGISTRKVWKAKVKDPQQLLAYVVAHPEFLHWIGVDEGAIAKYAQATSGRVPVPGVEIHQEEIIAARAA